MTTVLVAGGTGSIGRAIVEALVEQGKFKVIVLGRKSNAEFEERLGAKVIASDYASVDGLVSILEENKVDTVISALGGLAPPDAEKALIHAAEASSVTRRFIPSVFGVKYRPDQAWFPAAQAKLAAMSELEGTKLEWTIVCNGFFLDYWGMPKVKSYLNPMTLFIEPASKEAAIPGSGNTPVVFTYSQDVAKFTAALLTLDKWERESYVIGTKLSLNEFLRLAEEVRGEFKTTHDSLELLKSGKITELPGHRYAYEHLPKEALQGMLATFGLLFDEGQFDFKPERSLNDIFPEIKPVSAKDMLEIGWKN
ncbi:NAD(P)-bd-dom domain-containing protein [Fusarium sp. LHS14.1]|nr:NAD(P)-bd-dom domain-containing protein [Fusarium sp. LHS14.1]